MALLEAEKELTRRSDELARQRQELPWVRIDKDYRFDTDDGEASLSDLFRGRSQLLVHHSMFSPNWTEGCPTCSSMAGRSNPFEIVEHARGAAMTTDRRRPAGIVDPARDPGSSYRPGVARLPSRSERP